MKKKNYKISVIIPIYKVEEYLEETILSVVNQTIGFDNIQMILVNDGSPDNSEEICLKYKNKYPNNVIYIKQENSGVSAARNHGLKYATGEFVNFLDSDDKYGLNAFKVGYDMLNLNDIDIVSFRMIYFDAKSTPVYLDYKFSKGNRIINLCDEPYNPIYHVTSVLIRRSILSNILFDTRLKISEDVKFLCDVLVKTKKIGLISSECFYYRKRKNDTSAIQTSSQKLTYFIDTPKYCFDYILKLARKHKDMCNYLSYTVVFDLKWRIFNSKTYILSQKEKTEYIETIRKLLLKCDDRVICDQVINNPTYISYVFKELDFKYKKATFKNININNGYLKYNDINVLPVSSMSVEVYNLYVEKNRLYISTYFDYCLNNDYNMYLKVDNNFIKFEKKFISDSSSNLYSVDNDYYSTFFDLSVSLINVKKIELFIEISGKMYKVNANFTRFSKINNLKNSYYKCEDYTIIYENGCLLVNASKKFLCVRYLYELFKKDKLAFGMYLIYLISAPFFSNKIWLISDREQLAGDSGEVFYKYLIDNKLKKDIYFALDKKSKDYLRMKKIGKVVNFASLKFYLLFLHSECIISSHIDEFIHLPFGRKQIYLNNIIHYKFIFLQHGIIKDDLSELFNRYNMNISLFVTSTEKEYELIMHNNYMYNDDIVKLTGLPRYDKLYHSKGNMENIIALCPTWRASLAGNAIPRTQIRPYRDNFKNSNYFKFYNGLITNNKLLKFLKEKGFNIIFCLHPSFKEQISDFSSNKYVSVVSGIDYSELFKKSKLLITDYSSVVFDFAYLRKPIIYTQFDIDTFSESHTHKKKNDYNYERDGFGDVTYNIDDAVNKIIEIINNDCIMENRYKKRVENTFKYNDTKNCERVYNEIMNLLVGKENEKI